VGGAAGEQSGDVPAELEFVCVRHIVLLYPPKVETHAPRAGRFCSQRSHPWRGGANDYGRAIDVALCRIVTRFDANMSASGHTSAGYDHFKLLIENNLCGVLEFVSNSSRQSRGRTRAFGHECAWFECGETARPSRPMLASRGYQAPIGWTRL
jgi:hypothetical protein